MLKAKHGNRRGGTISDKAVIFNIQRFSTEDGPGIRTTIFFKGCPLKCTWCHNPEGISMVPQLVWYDIRCIAARDCLEACPEKALDLTPNGMVIDREKCKGCGTCAEECPAAALELIGTMKTAEELLDEVKRDSSFYKNSEGGVTLSGGEPLLQHKFLKSFIPMMKDAGLHVALDTTAYTSPDIFQAVFPLADMILLDLKHMIQDRSIQLTGVPVEPILRNARVLGESGKPVWVRTPVIPNATATTENIREVARFITKYLPNCERYDLLPFSNLCTSKYERLGMKFVHRDDLLIPESRMEEFKKIAEDEGVKNVVVSGLTTRNA